MFLSQYILNKVIDIGGRPYYPGAPEANAERIGVARYYENNYFFFFSFGT